MIKYYKTEKQRIYEEQKADDGVWIQMVAPSMEESQEIAELLDVDIDDIRAALDEEESSRIELEDGYTLILVDIPTQEIRHDTKTYTTIPLGIILTQDVIVTVCTEETPILQVFIQNRVREFSTKKKLRFVYQILFRTAANYQTYLRSIDKKRTEIEERIGGDTVDTDLIDLHELESTLVYFATSLRANAVVLDRLTRYKRLEQYPEDKELLEDVIVENRQAIEMTSIYRDIIDGTRELMSSVIDNRLNNVMKYLTSITIVMAIPTVISGIYGMNVNEKWMPFSDTPHGFLIICVLTLLICVITLWVLRKKKML
jgi:magnesium transporter